MKSNNNSSNVVTTYNMNGNVFLSIRGPHAHTIQWCQMIFIINRLDIIHRLTAQMRIFKSREIISQTRRKYQKLPEIQQRQQMECDMKIRRNHRMLVNMFSKVRFIHVLHTYKYICI